MISTAIGWILFAGGFGGIVWASYNLRRALQSQTWPRAAGQVLASSVETSQSDGMTMYRAEVRYKYNIGNRELVGSRVFFGDQFKVSWSGPANELSAKYRPGAAIRVAYHPEDPSLAVLEPGANWQTYGGLGLTIAVAAMGAAVALGLIPT